MYSAYSVPNILLPLFAGQLVDKYGARKMLTACFIITLVGNFVFAIGGALLNFKVVLIGRFIYGLGSEVYANCVYVMLTIWFIEKHLNLSYGINGLPPCAAIMLGGVFTPRLFGSEKHPHLGQALFMGFWISLVSLGFLIPMNILDKKMEDE